MTEFVSDKFDQIYSIELNEKLYLNAKRRLSKYNNIELIQGDSGKKICGLMKKINSNCMFWLDSHYSSGVTSKGEKYTLIINELNCILNHKCKNHVILIDDANDFCERQYYIYL